MNEATQPMTAEERRRVAEWRRQGMVPFLGYWAPPAHWSSPNKEEDQSPPYAGDMVRPYGDGPNPGEMEIDWSAINREFS